MLYHPSRTERLAAIMDRLGAANYVTDDLISAIVSETYDGGANDSGHVPAHIGRLISASAWTDAGLALVANKLPQWKLRRLVYDEGQWHCSLSLQPELPEWLDQAIETSHSNLSLAILKGVVEAMRHPAEMPATTRTPTVPCIRSMHDEMICCDNFT